MLKKDKRVTDSLVGLWVDAIILKLYRFTKHAAYATPASQTFAKGKRITAAELRRRSS
jgi:hypothetical protein